MFYWKFLIGMTSELPHVTGSGSGLTKLSFLRVSRRTASGTNCWCFVDLSRKLHFRCVQSVEASGVFPTRVQNACYSPDSSLRSTGPRADNFLVRRDDVWVVRFCRSAVYVPADLVQFQPFGFPIASLIKGFYGSSSLFL